jgi:hypothetical protein
MKTTYIYKLIDPTDNTIRYIGKANNPEQRFKAHCNKARYKPTHTFNWLKSLRERGLKPVMEIIENTPIATWKQREKYWIKHFTDEGCNLTNYTKGGDGLSFGNQTSYTKGSNNMEVLVFDLDGNKIDILPSCKKAEEVYGRGVGHVLSRRRKTQRGLTFVYTDRFDGDVKKLIRWATTRERTSNQNIGLFKKGQKSLASKKVEVEIINTGEVMVFDSAKAAAAALNINVGLVQWGCTKNKPINKKQYKTKYL